ncbi:related to tol protein [Fusarium fujikuroi]|nr:related to tol protein [Fusarium fujikuroi]
MSYCAVCQRSILYFFLDADARRGLKRALDLEPFSILEFAMYPSDYDDRLLHRFQHYDSISELQKSAISCELCSLMLPFLLESSIIDYNEAHFDTKFAVRRRGAIYLLPSAQHTSNWKNAKTLPQPVYDRNSDFYFFDNLYKTGGYSHAWVTKRAIWATDHIKFEARVETIQNWLGNCLTDHEECRVPEVRRPARFLVLHASVDDGDLRLVSTANLSQLNRIKYTALSHCWGSNTNHAARTTRENVHQKMTRISFHSLPKTFQDAIKVTRAIGIWFIWIDSLCIIQNDGDDWAMEASKMADVYRGSYLTLAASSSPDANGGLFLDCQTPAKAVNFSPELFPPEFEQKLPKSCLFRHPVASRAAILDGPLSKRAWVLQEQILSTRLIHFTNTQMFYQCTFGLNSEDGVISSRLSELPSPQVEFKFDYSLKRPFLWFKWVTEFSARHLSFDSDRIPAMAGLIKHYEHISLQRPILGLWDGTFWIDLAWYGYTPASSKTRHNNDTFEGIPSWTWFSSKAKRIHNLFDDLCFLDGGHFPEENSKVKLIHYSCDWTGPPYASKLKGAELRVSGSLKPVRLQHPTSASLPFLDGDNTFDSRQGSENGQPPGLLLYLDSVKMNLDQDRLFLLRLFTANVKDSISDLDDFVLLLREESHNNNTVFRRLGAGYLARPQPEPFILFITTHLSCLDEPMDEESLDELFKKPEAPPAFFDDAPVQEVILV